MKDSPLPSKEPGDTWPAGTKTHRFYPDGEVRFVPMPVKRASHNEGSKIVMFRWFRNWQWKRQREMDLKTLWPECKRRAPDLDIAKAVFMVHAINDRAWVIPYGEKLWKVIDALE